jgi:hypothetical protein
MRYEVVLAPHAAEAFRLLPQDWRNEVRAALERHSRHSRHGVSPVSEIRIERLDGLRPPQYWLQVGRTRVYCDLQAQGVEVLAVVRVFQAAGLADPKGIRSRTLRLAETREILILRDGRPFGVLAGFAGEDARIDYRLERDPGFLRCVAEAREALRGGAGVRLEHL